MTTTYARKAFTLVELLIVIGIIGLLAVTVLLTLNPAEAQRKSRDTKRIRDASTIQAALEQIVNEGLSVPSGSADTLGGANGVLSSTGSAVNANVTSQNCTSGSHWLGAIDLCPYVKTVPLDPQNGSARNFMTCSGAGCTPASASVTALYRARVSGSDYEVNVRQESSANVTKLTGDGGNSNAWFEVFSGSNTLFGD